MVTSLTWVHSSTAVCKAAGLWGGRHSTKLQDVSVRETWGLKVISTLKRLSGSCCSSMLGHRSGEDVGHLSAQAGSVCASLMSPLPSQTCLKCCGPQWCGARGITALTVWAIHRPRVHKPQMVLEPEPVDIYTANPSKQSKHKNGEKLLHLWLWLHLWLRLHMARRFKHHRNSPPTVCVGGALLPALQLYPLPSPFPILLHFTKQSQIKHKLT